MTVCDLDRIDGLATTIDGKGLAFFLADHLEWDSEYVHLDILQDKINLYIDYFVTEKYKNTEKYRERDFEYALIELYLKYELTEKAEEFLAVLNKQMENFNMHINYRVSE